MAFLPTVTAGYVGAHGQNGKTLFLPGVAVWSETGTLPFTTTKAAPPSHDSAGDPAYTVIFPVDTVISIGRNPDPVSGPIYCVPANTERTFYAQPGDKLGAKAA